MPRLLMLHILAMIQNQLQKLRIKTVPYPGFSWLKGLSND